MYKKGLAMQTYILIGIAAVILSAIIFTIFSYSSSQAPQDIPDPFVNDTTTQPPVAPPINTTPQQTHLACVNRTCTIVSGAGLNTCISVGLSCGSGGGGSGGSGGGGGSGSSGSGTGPSCTASAPSAPSLLQNGGSSSPNSIFVMWVDNSNNEESFIFERSRDNFVTVESSTTLAANALNYTDTQIAQGQTYYYRLKARNCGGDSAYSNVLTATVSIPVCGNNILQTGEMCDDGNTNANDGCSSTCSIESIAPPSGGICNPGHLNYVRTHLNDPFVLICDIDLRNYNFQPIGDENTPFAGSFNGQSHTISNFRYDNVSTLYAGLFGAIGSQTTISNLILSNVNVRAQTAGGVAGRSQGVITRVTVNGSVAGFTAAGMIAGEATGSLNQLRGSGTVTATNGGSNNALGGGLFGNLATQSTVDRVSYEGAVTCLSTTGCRVGGIAGFAGLGSVAISNAYAKATLTGGDARGGLVGLMSGTAISGSYAFSNLGPSTLARGGLVGLSQGGTIMTSYWNVDSSGTTQSVGSGNALGGTGLRAWQMYNPAKFSGFDFMSIWTNDSGCMTPWLRFEPINAPASCLASGLVLNYPFTEMTNAITPDISWGEHPGVAVNTHIAQQTPFGPVMAFGPSAYVATNADIDLNEAFTLSTWIRLDSLPSQTGDDSYRLIDKSLNGASFASYTLLVNSTGKVIGRTRSQNAAPSYEVVSAQPLAINQWYHVVLLLQPTNQGTFDLKLYINGAQSGSLSNVPSPAYNNDDSVIVGGQGSNTVPIVINTFRGHMRDVRIYNVALTPGQIQGLGLFAMANATFVTALSPEDSFVGSNLPFILWLHLLLLIMLIILLIIAVVVKRRRSHSSSLPADKPKPLPPYSPQPQQTIPQTQRQVIPVTNTQPVQRSQVVSQMQRPQSVPRDDRSHFLT